MAPPRTFLSPQLVQLALHLLPCHIASYFHVFLVLRVPLAKSARTSTRQRHEPVCRKYASVSTGLFGTAAVALPDRTQLQSADTLTSREVALHKMSMMNWTTADSEVVLRDLSVVRHDWNLATLSAATTTVPRRSRSCWLFVVEAEAAVQEEE